MILQIFFIILLAILVGAAIALMRFPTTARLQKRVQRQGFFFGLNSIILMSLFWLIFMYPNLFLLIPLAIWMSMVLLQLVMIVGYGGAASYPRAYSRKKKSMQHLMSDYSSDSSAEHYHSADSQSTLTSEKGAK